MINVDELLQAKEREAKLEAREMMKEAVNLSYDATVDDEEIPEVEEDWNEGATIVIGRTQFFLGSMREYVGMPASNPMDAKDRVLGQGLSGAARRKPAVHRTGDRWISGDYGSKESDSFV